MRLLVGILINTFFIFASIAQSKSESDLISGTVYTSSGNEYTGYIRWGKEEMYWHDIFNSEKVSDTKLINPIFNKKKNAWFDWDFDFGSIWEDKYKTGNRTFACYFGDIDLIEVDDNDVTLRLKNGHQVQLSGGSNDIGTSLNIEDQDFGTMKIRWSKIEKVVFKEIDFPLADNHGDALYGIIKTQRKGQIEGYIKWDLAERNGNDILDGDSKEGDLKIPFKNIAHISKVGNGVDLTLHSDRTLYLDGSNDVNSGNRGIEVYQPEIGSVKISWREFKSVAFIKPNFRSPCYADFEIPRAIKVSIETIEDEILKGFMIYDIDEVWGCEILDGEDDYIEYQIPFRNIKEIQPKNREYSLVSLKNGDQLLLGETQDVSNRNEGLLLFSENDKTPNRIDWEDILKITFH